LIQTSFQYGHDQQRQLFQAMASYIAPVSGWFSLEAGGQYTRIADPAFFEAIEEPGTEFFEERSFERSAMPYLKPILHLGPITIAIPVSGLVAPGAKEGGWFAFAGGTIGYSRDRWSLHGGGSYHLLHLYSGDGQLDSDTWQATVGGRYDLDFEQGLVGLSVEAIFGEHTYQANFNDLSTGLVANQLVMVIGGLNLGWPIELD